MTPPGIWRQRLRRWVRPQLGILQQYQARPLRLPRRYGAVRPLASAPAISIVTPSLNQGRFLERTIRGVLAQRYPRLEYIVRDGGSTDETPGILERYRSALIRVESVPDDGFVHAINLGFRQAGGEILGYLNSDDLLLPGALRAVGRFFAEHPEVDVVYGHRVIVDEDDREVGRWVLPRHDGEILSWADWVPQETLFWRRRIWETIGESLDETFRFAVDWDLLLRLREAGARFARLPRFLGAFRVHPLQKSSAQMAEFGIGEMRRLRRRCHGRDVSAAEIERATGPYLRRHLVYQDLYRLGLLRY